MSPDMMLALQVTLELGGASLALSAAHAVGEVVQFRSVAVRRARDPEEVWREFWPWLRAFATQGLLGLGGVWLVTHAILIAAGGVP